jgi:hypothetical protein
VALKLQNSAKSGRKDAGKYHCNTGTLLEKPYNFLRYLFACKTLDFS